MSFQKYTKKVFAKVLHPRGSNIKSNVYQLITTFLDLEILRFTISTVQHENVFIPWTYKAMQLTSSVAYAW